MKFGNFLTSERRPKWILYYFDYCTLKLWLKDRLKDLESKTKNLQTLEKQFNELIESEIDKVNTFYLKTHTRILGKIDSLRAVLVGTALVTPESAGGSRKTQDLRDALLGQISHIDSQINSLWHFCWINHLAVWKLMKKHDKHTGLVATPWCMKIAEE